MKTKIIFTLFLLMAGIGSALYAQKIVYGDLDHEGFKKIKKGAMWGKRPEIKKMYEGYYVQGYERRILDEPYFVCFEDGENNVGDINYIVFEKGELICHKIILNPTTNKIQHEYYAGICGNKIKSMAPVYSSTVVSALPKTINLVDTVHHTVYTFDTIVNTVVFENNTYKSSDYQEDYYGNGQSYEPYPVYAYAAPVLWLSWPRSYYDSPVYFYREHNCEVNVNVYNSNSNSNTNTNTNTFTYSSPKRVIPPGQPANPVNSRRVIPPGQPADNGTPATNGGQLAENNGRAVTNDGQTAESNGRKIVTQPGQSADEKSSRATSQNSNGNRATKTAEIPNPGYKKGANNEASSVRGQKTTTTTRMNSNREVPIRTTKTKATRKNNNYSAPRPNSSNGQNNNYSAPRPNSSNGQNRNYSAPRQNSPSRGSSPSRSSSSGSGGRSSNNGRGR